MSRELDSESDDVLRTGTGPKFEKVRGRGPGRSVIAYFTKVGYIYVTRQQLENNKQFKYQYVLT